jgi:hypothetical protein
MKNIIAMIGLLALTSGAMAQEYFIKSMISAPVTNAAAASGLVSGVAINVPPGGYGLGIELVCTNGQATTNQGTITLNFTTTYDGTNYLTTNWIPLTIPVGSNATRWHTNLSSAHIGFARSIKLTNVVNSHGVTNIVNVLRAVRSLPQP